MNGTYKKWMPWGVPILLTALFCIISVISLTTILHMQGNARVINYTGIVRGATQRLVKQELYGTANDQLILALDEIMAGLTHGDEENGLIALSHGEYQNLMAQMNGCWGEIKEEIGRVRQGADGQRLYEMSESYFELADRAVSSAERYSESQVGTAKRVLICLNICFVLLTALFWLHGKRQKKVQAALDVAEHASRAKGEFLSRMSHEIRTPLNGIIGMTEIAQMYPNDPGRQEDCLKKIGMASNYLLSLINDILDMSRIESGKIELDPKEFDIKELFDQIQGILCQRAQENGVVFQTECGQLSASRVVGDDLRLAQVLINLASNALKFTPPGGTVTLEVRQRMADEKAIDLEFVVADTGIGISEEFQARIFQPFEQEAAVTGRQYGGTGLGLAISSNFVKMMGGEISVHSQPGHGSQFVVRLTLQRAKEAAGQEKTCCDQTDEASGAPVRQLTGVRVLLAEDNDINAEIVTVILEKNGARVDWAHNGKEAADLFENAPTGVYTLILMDIKMPVMDGLEATRRIRRMSGPDAATIPIIGLSANAFSEDIDLAMRSGMSGYLSKPINVAKFLATIRQYQTSI